MGTYRRAFRLNAPPERVWELMVDPDRLPEWNGAFDRVTEATGHLDEIGATYTQVMRVAGVELLGEWEITGVETNQQREFSGRPPGMTRCKGVETFDAVDGTTEYTLEMNYTLARRRWRLRPTHQGRGSPNTARIAQVDPGRHHRPRCLAPAAETRSHLHSRCRGRQLSSSETGG